MLLLRVTSMSKGINFTPSPLKVLYNPKAFFIHAAWLHQALRPLSQYSPLLPPWESGPCLRFQCGWSSSDQPGSSPIDEPLPHLLANPIWAHPMARGRRSSSLVLRRYAVLATVSSSYPLHQAVSQIYHLPLSKEASFFLLPFDLHVGLPPAFQSEP